MQTAMAASYARSPSQDASSAPTTLVACNAKAATTSLMLPVLPVINMGVRYAMQLILLFA